MKRVIARIGARRPGSLKLPDLLQPNTGTSTTCNAGGAAPVAPLSSAPYPVAFTECVRIFHKICKELSPQASRVVWPHS